MELAEYLRRIGYAGPVAADLATLRALARAHIHAIPFENFDVHLRAPLGIASESAWDKIVTRGRGGWCYEMNAVFGAALALIGFRVTRHACAVMREEGSAEGLGGHLALSVECEGDRWLADVGFGSKLLGPLPLEATSREDAPFTVALIRTGDGYWRFIEQGPGAAPFWFDFRDEPADETLLADRCTWQQSDPASNFTRTLTAQIRDHDRHFALRGRELSTSSPDGLVKRMVEAAEYATLMRDTFRTPLDPALLWDKVLALESRAERGSGALAGGVS